MKRIFSVAALFLLSCSLLFAQTDVQETPSTEESEESEVTFKYQVIKKGDNFIQLNLALSIPARPQQLSVGGEVAIGYTYMMTDHISLGGEACFSYNSTIGKNVLYFIPLLVTGGYHMTFGDLEVVGSISLGGAFENYLDRSYFGLAIKPEVSVFYKFFSEWSIGLSAGLFILPEWYRDSSKNYTSLIPDIRLGAKYYF